MLNVKRKEYDVKAAFTRMQRETTNPTPRPKHQSGSRQCVQGASGCSYSGSTCNCSYCLSNRSITRPKDAGLLLRARLDRWYRKDAGTRLREQLDNFYRSSEEENRRIAEDAEKSKRLLRLTDRLNRKRDYSWDDINDYEHYPNYRNF